MSWADKSKHVELGVIEYTHLGFEDHGIFTFSVGFDFGGSGQAFGNWGLSLYDKEKNDQIGTKEGLDAIMGVLRAAGVDEWEDLKGKVMWVERDESGYITAIEAPKFVEGGGRFDIRTVFPKKD